MTKQQKQTLNVFNRKSKNWSKNYDLNFNNANTVYERSNFILDFIKKKKLKIIWISVVQPEI